MEKSFGFYCAIFIAAVFIVFITPIIPVYIIWNEVFPPEYHISIIQAVGITFVTQLVTSQYISLFGKFLTNVSD